MPTVFPPSPAISRIRAFLWLLFMNNFVKCYLFVRRNFVRSGFYTHSPTFRLRIDQKKLISYWSPNEIEIYLPKSYAISLPSSLPFTSPRKYPIFFDIHGGGFNIGHPTLDAEFCRYISDKADCIVIALPYRKSPYVKWPTQVHEITALVEAILEDERLDHLVDKTKVTTGGFSAGGNLATVLSIQKSLQGKIQSIVPVYPVLDWTTTTEQKIASRPKNAPPDLLRKMGDRFSIGYIPLGTDREHPNLSPLFAKAEDLPDNIYLVGCEWDMLNADARKFYEKFKGVKKNLVYDEVKEARHGFTHEGFERLNKEADKKLGKMSFELYDRIAEWLTTKVWHTRSGDASKVSQDESSIVGDAVVTL